MKTIMHINYCEQGQSIAEACAKASQWGFDGIEFRRKRAEYDQETYLDVIQVGYEAHGLSAIHFGASIALSSDDRAKQEKNLEDLFHFFESASRRFPLTVCTLHTDWLENPAGSKDCYEMHGSALATEEILARQIEGLKKIAQFAESLRFRLGLETHPFYSHDLPAATKRILDAVDSPALGVVLDYGNMLGFPEPLSFPTCLDVLGNSVWYLHIKNSLSTGTRFRQRCSLADGEINHRTFFKQLQAFGYSGNICIESPRQGDREHFAQVDLAYCKVLAGELNLTF